MSGISRSIKRNRIKNLANKGRADENTINTKQNEQSKKLNFSKKNFRIVLKRALKGEIILTQAPNGKIIARDIKREKSQKIRQQKTNRKGE